MIIINPGPEDYHIHSMNFSDGINTIDEIVIFAGKLGLKKIAITDHSDAVLKASGVRPSSSRTALFRRWKNLHNDVQVIFGVEADLLNEKGDICNTINNEPAEFTILSAHLVCYKGVPEKITEGFIKAMEKHKISMIGHPYVLPLGVNMNMKRLVEAANRMNIPLEFNTAYLFKPGEQSDEKLKEMLTHAKRIYVNSDAHTLHCMIRNRKAGFEFLKKHGFM